MIDPNYSEPAPDAPGAEDSAITPGAELPLELRLSPKAEGGLHAKILGRILSRKKMAEQAMSGRHDRWDEVDDQLRMYVDLRQQAKRGDGSSDSSKKEMPFQRSLMVPASFAIHQVRVTEFMGIVAGRSPVFQYEGRSSDDVTPAKKLEAMIAYDFQMSNGLGMLHTLVSDADRYGTGVVYDVWEDEVGMKVVGPPPILGLEPMLQTLGLGALAQSSRARQMFPNLFRPRTKWGVKREGNRWHSIDPSRYYPDPRVPISEVQRGEFVGHNTEEAYVYLRGGPYFNLEHAKEYAEKADKNSPRSRRNRRFAEDYSLTSSDDKDQGFYEIDQFQIRLVPSEWELGEGTDPEIWWFSVLAGCLVIRAHPSAYGHDQFTYAVGEVLADPHAQTNPGMVEQMDSLQRIINWLVNSRVENVRLTLNNAFIYVKEWLEEEDLLNPGPGWHIRLTAAGARAVKDGNVALANVIHQLAVADITGQNMDLVQFFYEMMQRMGASTDAAQGQPLPDKRTLGELQMVTGGASARNLTTMRILDAQALQPLALRAAANRQQFTTLQEFYRITGDPLPDMDPGAERIPIGPNDVHGNYDYVAHDVGKPTDPARSAETWRGILDTVAAFPLLQQPDMASGKYLDIRKVANEMFRQGGVKNIDEFYTQLMPIAPPQLTVAPDEEIARELQAGNIVPADQGEIPSGGIG